MQYTLRDVWGFSTVHAAMPEDPTNPSRDYVADFMKAANEAARERGITRLNVPSDALDQSRDLILDEAARSLSAVAEIVNETLTLTHDSLLGQVDWISLLDRNLSATKETF